MDREHRLIDVLHFDLDVPGLELAVRAFRDIVRVINLVAFEAVADGYVFRRDDRGAAVIETAFALPCLILLVWMVVQLGLVFRAMSGIQHGLGQGARLATLFPKPTNDAIHTAIQNAVYGMGPGTFTINTPVAGTADGANYLDLKVTYVQPTDMLLFPGPTITVSRSKRVWIAD